MDTASIKQLILDFYDIIKSAFLIRKVEERILQLFNEGQIKGTVHTCIGQELIGPCLKKTLKENDFIVSNHRGHGHYLAMTGNIAGLIAEIMGKNTGICR